ncbi:tenomodulin [Gastrophryne carolinensis]
MRRENITQETGLQDEDIIKPKKWTFKKCAILSLSACFVIITCLLLLFLLKDFWKQIPEKVYDVEYKFFNAGEKTKVLMEIDPRRQIETFRTENGTDSAVEIHDFKHGITGIYFTDLQKCFIKRQSKEIPEWIEAETVEIEDGEITSTIYEESVFWVPAQEPIQDREFLKNSKISEMCNNASVHWMHPASPSAPKFQDFEDLEEAAAPPNKEEKHGHNRQGRSLTERDERVNDYREIGMELPDWYDRRGFCCSHCRRGQRYCRRVCEPLLGFYPHPYCYEGGRVICRIIMPCNWWVARMLGRV